MSPSMADPFISQAEALLRLQRWKTEGICSPLPAKTESPVQLLLWLLDMEQLPVMLEFHSVLKCCVLLGSCQLPPFTSKDKASADSGSLVDISGWATGWSCASRGKNKSITFTSLLNCFMHSLYGTMIGGQKGGDRGGGNN